MIISSVGEAILRLSALSHCPVPLLPKASGVYVFDRLGETLYIGESRNLKRRLSHHERGFLHRTIAVRCRVLVCCNHKQVERWLIQEMSPTLNGVPASLRLRGADDLARMADRLALHAYALRATNEGLLR